MSEPHWLSQSEVEAIHTAVLKKDGGAEGIHDETLLQSALARPRNLSVYGETEHFQLAASYAEAIAKNHAFVDGNKRTAFTSAMLFLKKNGHSIAPNKAFPDQMVSLAEGTISREDFGSFLKANARKKDQQRGETRSFTPATTNTELLRSSGRAQEAKRDQDKSR